MTFKILNTFILILAKLLIGLNFSFANDIKLPSIVVGKKCTYSHQRVFLLHVVIAQAFIKIHTQRLKKNLLIQEKLNLNLLIIHLIDLLCSQLL